MHPYYLILTFFSFHEMIINLGGDVYRSQRPNKLILLFFVGDCCLSRIQKITFISWLDQKIFPIVVRWRTRRNPLMTNPAMSCYLNAITYTIQPAHTVATSHWIPRCTCICFSVCLFARVCVSCFRVYVYHGPWYTHDSDPSPTHSIFASLGPSL